MGIELIGREQAAFSRDGVVTTDYERDGIVKGQGFTFAKNFSILTGATLYVLFDYTTFLKTDTNSGIIFVLPPEFATTSGPVIVNVYRGTNYSGGTQFIAYNANTSNAKTSSGTTLTSGATGATKGDVVRQYLVGGQAQGANTAAGSTSGLGFFIRPNTGKTLVEIVNQSGNAITFNYSQTLYEV